MSTENEKIKYLVADTTAFINAVPLNVGKQFVFEYSQCNVYFCV